MIPPKPPAAEQGPQSWKLIVGPVGMLAVRYGVVPVINQKGIWQPWAKGVSDVLQQAVPGPEEQIGFMLPKDKDIVIPQLTARENKILLLRSYGITNAAIATKLSVPEEPIDLETIKNHVATVRRKLHARNVAQAFANSIALGLSSYALDLQDAPVAISERGLQMGTYVAQGDTDIEIGRKLYITKHTVNGHLRKLFRNINAKNRYHAVRRLFELGRFVVVRQSGTT